MPKTNDKPTSSEKDSDTETPSSSAIMLTTIMLLIGGLLLTSAMLIHYGFKNAKESDTFATNLSLAQETAKSKLSKNFAHAKTRISASRPFATNSQETAAKPSKINFKNLFAKHGKSPARWPKLELSGFGILSHEKTGFAIINQKRIMEGSTIKGVKVLKILSHGVLVEYKGETKTLIVETTD